MFGGFGRRQTRGAAVYDEVCQGRTRAQDPDRLSAEQSDQHVDLRLLAPRPTGSAGIAAPRLEGPSRPTRSVDLADRTAPPSAPSRRPMGRLLDGFTTRREAIFRGGTAASRVSLHELRTNTVGLLPPYWAKPNQRLEPITFLGSSLAISGNWPRCQKGHVARRHNA